MSYNFSFPSLRLSVFWVRVNRYGFFEESCEVDCSLFVALTVHFNQNSGVNFDGGFLSLDMDVCDIE